MAGPNSRCALRPAHQAQLPTPTRTSRGQTTRPDRGEAGVPVAVDTRSPEPFMFQEPAMPGPSAAVDLLRSDRRGLAVNFTEKRCVNGLGAELDPARR